MTAATTDKMKARPDQIRALARLRRAHGVTLDALAQSTPWSKSSLSRALAGYVSLTRGDVRALRERIQELSRGGA